MSDAALVARVIRRLRLEADRAGSRLRDASRRRRNAGRSFRPIFVTGAIGSGTSLLAASLSQRLSVAGVALESARQIDPRSCLWIDRVDAFPSLEAYEAALDPAPDWSSARAAEDLQQLYRAKAVDASLIPIVDKGPNTNLVRAGFLAEAFPESSFVLIFRDPVSNVEGLRRKWQTFRDVSLAECVRFWAAVHERFLEQAAAFPERVVCVEYEALVADYEASLTRLAEVLGVPMAERVRPVEARAEGHGRGLRGVSDGQIHVVPEANAASYERLGASLDAAPDSLRRAEALDGIRRELAPLHERLRELARASGVALGRDGST
jgi:hypothetical protein